MRIKNALARSMYLAILINNIAFVCTSYPHIEHPSTNSFDEALQNVYNQKPWLQPKDQQSKPWDPYKEKEKKLKLIGTLAMTYALLRMCHRGYHIYFDKEYTSWIAYIFNGVGRVCRIGPIGSHNSLGWSALEICIETAAFKTALDTLIICKYGDIFDVTEHLIKKSKQIIRALFS